MIADLLPPDEPVLQIGSITLKTVRKDVIVEEGERGGLQYRSGFDHPLSFYIRRRHITPEQFRAGHKYFVLWHYSVLRLRYARMNFGEIGGEYDPESMSNIPREYLEAQKAIMNPAAREAVYNVCCLGIKAGKRGGMAILKDGLDDLIKHFRIEN